jgi:hypothetical protein
MKARLERLEKIQALAEEPDFINWKLTRVGDDVVREYKTRIPRPQRRSRPYATLQGVSERRTNGYEILVLREIGCWCSANPDESTSASGSNCACCNRQRKTAEAEPRRLVEAKSTVFKLLPRSCPPHLLSCWNNLEVHLLTNGSGQEPTHGMGLPAGAFNELLSCHATWPLQQFKHLIGLTALARSGGLVWARSSPG